MFTYAKVGHSKFVEMHGGHFRFLSIRIQVWLVLLESIYRTVYMQTGVKVNTSAITKIEFELPVQ